MALSAVMLLAMTACSSITPNAGTTNTAIGGTDASTAPATPLATASIVLKVSHPDNDTSMLENTWNATRARSKTRWRSTPTAR